MSTVCGRCLVESVVYVNHSDGRRAVAFTVHTMHDVLRTTFDLHGDQRDLDLGAALAGADTIVVFDEPSVDGL